MQEYNPHQLHPHSHTSSTTSSHKRYKHKKKRKKSPQQQISPNAEHHHSNKLLNNQRYSGHSDQKDDAKEESAQIGFDSASNTISPQQQQQQISNDNANIINSSSQQPLFSEATVNEMSANLGFEQEYVRMALVQSNGDKAFAAEILFQLNDKTKRAIRKIEKQKKKNLQMDIWSKIFGCNVKDLKKKWKEQIIENLSKSQLRSLARKQCVHDHDDEDSVDSDSETESFSDSAMNESFYKKHKNEIPTLCQSAISILFLLQLYESFKKYKMRYPRQQNQNVFFVDFIDSYLSHYSLVQMMNDFEHLHIFHWDHCELFAEFESQIGECTICKCQSFKRHFRDRSKYKKDVKRYKLYGINLEMENAESEIIKKEIVCLQLLDEIHCYLMHSLMKFEEEMFDESDDDDQTEYTEDTRTEYSKTTSFHSPSNSKTNLSVHYDANNTANAQKIRQSVNYKMLMQRKEELIKFGYARSYGTKFEEKSQRSANSVFEWHKFVDTKPHFNNVKEEILNNPYCKLSLNEFDEVMFKTTIISKTWIRKKIKAKEKFVGCIGIEFDQKKQKEKEIKVRIKKGDAISIDFIFAIKLYTDYDKLQSALKQCLRFDGHKQPMHNLSYFYWWHQIIFLTVSKFGIKMKKHKFFYGCKQRMEFSNFGGFGLFHGPLSMTISLEVAKQFATSQGMLLQIGNAHPWIKGNDSGNGRYFDVSCLSDYKNEHEILCMLFSTRLHMISLNCFIPENIANVDAKLFDFICALFEKCIFSMNFELEQLFIQLLNFQLRRKGNFKKYRVPKEYALKFANLCFEREQLLIWDISFGLHDFFMISTEYDDDFDDDSITIDNVNKYNENDENDTKLLISFEKINDLFVNLESLTLINHTLSNEIFYQFIDYLNKRKKNGDNVSFKIITFYFPKYKKLPHRLKINQLQHVWSKYLNQHKWHIVGYKYGTSLSPMIVLERMDLKIKPFMGHDQSFYHQQFVKIEK